MANDLPDAPWATPAVPALPDAPWATNTGPKSFGDRLSNTWENATPGGPLWIVRQGLRGAKRAVEGSIAATAPDGGSELDALNRRVGRQREIEGVADAASVLTPGAPRGTGLLGAIPSTESAVFSSGALPRRAVATPEGAANRAAAEEFGVSLTRGQAERDNAAVRNEDLASRGAYGEAAAKRAAGKFDEQFRQVQDAGRGISEDVAGSASALSDTPSDAARVVMGEFGGRADAARTVTAEAERAAAAEAEAQRAIVADQARALDEAVRGGALPIENPREAGEIVGQNVRDAAAAQRADFKAKYKEFGELPGEIGSEGIKGMGNRIRGSLTNHEIPVVIDDQLTPAASKAIQAIDVMQRPTIQNRAQPPSTALVGEGDSGEPVAVTLKGVDQMRKKLVAYYQAAKASNNASDIRATSRVMTEFDNQIEKAVSDGLFSGDPRALEVLKEARASFSRYNNLYKPRGGGDDVGVAMRRIVERNATPEETANLIIGSGKIGNAGLPVRLANRLEEVLGSDSDSWSAVRQAMLQKASQVRNAAGEVDAQRSARSMLDFVGSSLAQRMFTPQERAAMRAHAVGMRDLDKTIAALPATERAAAIKTAYQEAFGGDALSGPPAAAFRKIVEGTASPEEVSNGIFKVIGSGNPGNAARAIKAIERVVGTDSEAMAAVRQGVWQKLTANAEGRDAPGYQKLKQSIRAFTDGPGQSIAESLYTPAQVAMMRRYANVVERLIPTKYAQTNSDTTPALMSVLRNQGSNILGVLAHKIPVVGPFAAALAGKMAERNAATKQFRGVSDSLDDVVTPAKGSLRPYTSNILRRSAPGDVGIAAKLIPYIQGTAPVRADDQQSKGRIQ